MLGLARYTLRRRLGGYQFHTSPVLFVKRKVQKTFKLADIGEGITECEVLKWSVKAPAKVDHFDLLCEVQSDKATVEITSPFDGVVSELLVKEGEIAKVGQGLCVIDVEEDGHDEPEVKSEQPTSSRPPPAAPDHKPEARTSSPPPTPPRRLHPLDPNYSPPPKSTPASVPSSSKASPPDPEAESKTSATPSVRHFARSVGIPRLSDLFPGSGKNGRIEKTDVEAWMARSSGSETQSSTSPNDIIGTKTEDDTVLELGRTRWAMWKAMEQSLKIPHFGYSTTLDLTNIHSALHTLNANIPVEFKPPSPSKFLPAVSPNSILPNREQPQLDSDPNTHYDKLTYLPLLIKSLSRAMQEWPLFRSSISFPSDAAKPSLVVRPHSDIAIALSTPTGLYTPVIQSADTKSAFQLMGELRRFSALGRTVPHGLTPREMPKRGATVTVSNVGAIGKGEFAAPLLVPGGGVAIVAIGRAKWVQNDLGKRLEVGVSWSADHRVVEGAEMAAFTESWRKWAENPVLLAAAGI